MYKMICQTECGKYTTFNDLDLSALSLARLRLLKVPRKISKFTNLEYLNLSFNNLTIFPIYIFHESLNTLRLQYNNIIQCPPEIGKFKNLNRLILSDNKLKIISHEINKLINLNELNLSRNPLKFLPLLPGSIVDLYLYNTQIIICFHSKVETVHTHQFIYNDDI